MFGLCCFRKRPDSVSSIDRTAIIMTILQRTIQICHFSISSRQKVFEDVPVFMQWQTLNCISLIVNLSGLINYDSNNLTEILLGLETEFWISGDSRSLKIFSRECSFSICGLESVLKALLLAKHCRLSHRVCSPVDPAIFGNLSVKKYCCGRIRQLKKIGTFINIT